ncbi:putative membrane protein [Stackebrandtia albiflava]|uniref:Putative membrane protein n=1 Tax=Stackebrandtia albiflava TaxID=406432 RepID=A0A562V3X3_9ACTN|nr:EamA family transporter [Stackebrandtia albiflava]TWJ12599.1 putative membrane protein [Stackebrandtia albiflava]
MAVGLALASAAVYGLVDFFSGVLSRRASPAFIAVVGQGGAFAVGCLVALLLPATEVGWPDLAWGVASGIGSGFGMLFLMRGTRRGAVSVVVALSAVGGITLPVLAGVLLLGDRPSITAWLGILAALPALWLVSRTGDDPAGAAGVPDALVAAAAFALQYFALAQADAAAGLWPVVVGRLAAAVALTPTLRSVRADGGADRVTALWAVLVGVGAAVGLALYMVASQVGMLSIVVVLASLYPVLPVLLGVVVLRERLRWPQRLGLVAALAATVLLGLG